MCSFVFKPCKKWQKKNIQKPVARSETTLFCCLNVHLFSTAQYLKNIKEEKTPEIKSSKGTEDC